MRQAARLASTSADGFTLMELLLVLGILALAVALVRPVIKPHERHQSAESAARKVVAYLRATRSAAIVRNRPQLFAIDLEKRVITSDALGTLAELPSCLEVQITAATTTPGQPGPARIEFHPEGTSTGAAIDLRCGVEHVRLEIDWLTGGVTRVR